jgi:Leucine-rich repeat (LRR) protein
MAPKEPPKNKDSKDEKATERTGERASRPGAVSVPSSQQAELLDQRIEKTRTAASTAGSASVGASFESVDAKIAAKVRGDAKPGARQELQQVESAMQTKMANSNSSTSDAATKQSARASTAVPSRPGAYSATPSPNQTEAGLKSLDADDEAKQRARVGAVAERLDEKIAGKMRGDLPQAQQIETNSNIGNNSVVSDVASKNAARASRTAPAQPGAFASTGSSSTGDKGQAARLDDLESRISAKMAPSDARAQVTALEDSIQAKIRSHDTKGPSTNDLEAKIQAKMVGSTGARAHLENFEDAVHAKMRTDGQGAGADSQSGDAVTAAKVRTAAIPSSYQQLQNIESSLQAKISNNSGDSARGKSVDSKIAAQNPASLQAMQTLEANIQSKMNSANAASASPASLSNFECQILDKQSLGGGTVGELGEVSVTMARIPLDIQEIEDSLLQKARAGNLGNENASKDDGPESKVPQNDLLYDGADGGPDLEYGEYGGPQENGLAVAFAVDEEEDAYIPSAVEYDPDAKPPMYRNRRFRLYVSLTMVVMVVGTAGILSGLLLNHSSGTPPPLPERATVGIREYVERLVGPEPVSDRTNPYRKALDWIQDVDPMALTPYDKGFAQRFLTAYLYFSTTVHGPWNNDCDPAQQGETDDTVYRYTGVIEEKFNFALDAKRWLSKYDSCLWCAVECDSAGQIIKIDIGTLPPSSWRARTRWVSLSLLSMCSFPRSGRANITGTIPEGVTKLPYLRFLSLSHGQLVGPLPAAYSDMKHLYTLEVLGNRLTGTIPESLYSSRSLQRVAIGKNHLVGTLSKAIGRLKDLRNWYSHENELTGTIPVEVGDLHNAVWVWMHGNLHTGTIPSSVGTIRRIMDFVVHRNKLTGTIPSEIGGAATLEYFHVHFNKMTGTIPTELATLTDLQYLYLNDNQFTGSTDVLTNITSMQVLYFENNKFSGSLSGDFNRLTNMREMKASGNDLTGTVPKGLCNLLKPANKPGSKKFLTDLQMDCAPSADGTVEIDCPCCTVCCDSEGQDCNGST